jgi:glutaminyl-peptide cyclotransferase
MIPFRLNAWFVLPLALLTTTLAAADVLPTPASQSPRIVIPERLRVRVIRSLPHDPGAFTQGLLISGGAFYESTGMQGQSSLRHVDIETGKVLRRVDLEDRYFGEGLALVEDRLIQLTWTTGKAFVYSPFDFRKTGELEYQGEGWGLCFDGEHLVMSNGSDRLAFRHPQTFALVRERAVTHTGRALKHLNELECVDGKVYANVWMTERIVAIDPRSGQVTADIDASGLLTPAEDKGTDVMNGIAFDRRNGHFFITGKYWPKVFEVTFGSREER